MPAAEPLRDGPVEDRLGRFVAEFSRLLDGHPDEAAVRRDGAGLLARLVAQDDWLDPRHAQPGSDHYRQYLLHRDDAGRFSVVSFVWGPGQATPIHDHTVWGLIGVLRGAETAQPFHVVGPRQLQALEPVRLEPGHVAAVSPAIGDIHRVSNALRDRVSISIHVYGADIGVVERSVYQEDGARRRFVSGYSAAADATQQAHRG